MSRHERPFQSIRFVSAAWSRFRPHSHLLLCGGEVPDVDPGRISAARPGIGPSAPVPHQWGLPRHGADPTATLALPPSTRDKVRLRFRKDGALRLLSHHDLMRCFERMLRRAALPVRQSQGFHPKPRLIFALSLPLGVIGCEEVAELELDEILPLEEVRDRLVRQAPLGMEILSLRRIDFKAGAQIHSLTYRIALPPDRTAEASLRRRVDGRDRILRGTHSSNAAARQFCAHGCSNSKWWATTPYP